MTRIHYGSRHRIEQERIDVIAHGNDTGATIEVRRLTLDDFGFPGDATIVLEATSSKMGQERFDIGTVFDPLLGRPLMIPHVSPDNLLLRLKVSSKVDRTILGLADRIRPSLPDESEKVSGGSLLVVRKGSDLGHQVWRLEFTEDGGPELLINERVGDWRSFAAERNFQASVFPEVVSQIAEWTARGWVDEAGENSARGRWGRFFARIGCDPAGATSENSQDNLEEWLQDLREFGFSVARIFAQRHRAVEVFMSPDDQEDF